MTRKSDSKKLEELHSRYLELEGKLSDNSMVSNLTEYQKLAKEFSDLTPVVETLRAYKSTQAQLDELDQILKDAKSDPEFADMAEQEYPLLEEKLRDLDEQLDDFTNPQKFEKDRNLIIEIRAGTGGIEASLFAADLYRMYTKYAAMNGWSVEPIASNPSENNGYKEVIFSINGKGASKHLKWESGTHRVQRVPETEASGRIHTSAATVAVMFEPEEVDLEIDPKDLKIDVFRASGPGGQSVNTTDSAIRITHLPTNLVVICQDERSQLKNKFKAMRVLRARLLDKMEQEEADKQSQKRKAQVGSGDRSEKIRTYNFPDRRVTDHRIGFTSHRLQNILNGEMNELTEALLDAERKSIIEE